MCLRCKIAFTFMRQNSGLDIWLKKKLDAYFHEPVCAKIHPVENENGQSHLYHQADDEKKTVRQS